MTHQQSRGRVGPWLPVRRRFGIDHFAAGRLSRRSFLGRGDQSPVYTEVDDHGKRDDYVFHGPFVRLTATFGPAVMAAVAPPPAPPPAAAPKKNFLVFFAFDRSNITADAQKVITEAAAAAKAGNISRIQLTGHTDRSGSDQYNMALSLRRGEAVKQALIPQGIPAASIAVIGRGESQPLVPTADGGREPHKEHPAYDMFPVQLHISDDKIISYTALGDGLSQLQ